MKKHIPNIITSCNLISGCISVYYAFLGDFEFALLFIVAGAVFDFFDGMSARLLGVSSPIGKELDSLADDITFGFAPSAVLFTLLGMLEYPLVLQSVAGYIPYVAFVMAAFSALRLAKFNLDKRQATSFIGVPTPANALFWAALVAECAYTFLAEGPVTTCLIIVMLFVTSYLLVAEIPLFALKFKHWGIRGNEIKYIFVISSIVILISSMFVGYAAISIVIAWYVLLSVLTNHRDAKLKL